MQKNPVQKNISPGATLGYGMLSAKSAKRAKFRITPRSVHGNGTSTWRFFPKECYLLSKFIFQTRNRSKK